MTPTPREKAKELVKKYLQFEIELKGKYDGYITMMMHDAKQCALIAVDEILDILNHELGHDATARTLAEHYEQVKIELQKL